MTPEQFNQTLQTLSLSDVLVYWAYFLIGLFVVCVSALVLKRLLKIVFAVFAAAILGVILGEIGIPSGWRFVYELLGIITVYTIIAVAQFCAKRISYALKTGWEATKNGLTEHMDDI